MAYLKEAWTDQMEVISKPHRKKENYLSDPWMDGGKMRIFYFFYSLALELLGSRFIAAIVHTDWFSHFQAFPISVIFP